MSAPRWARALLARLAGPGREDEVVGDLEESHRRRVERRGRFLATILTALEALDVAWALLRDRRRSTVAPGSRDEGPTGGPRLGRPRRVPPISWVDVKLAFRVLVKHPALSVVSTLGMAVGVAIGATAFGVIHGMTSSPLPLDEGHRIVTIQNVTELGFEQARATHLHDLESWRTEVPALGEIGAYRIVTRNLVTPDGAVSPARVAQMTASGFRVARVPPLLGRTFIDADQREGAPAVAVIGHGVWRDRFGGDPDVLDRTLQIGATRHAIVGVMPEGFAFPINNRVWTPLRLDASAFPAGRAPRIDVFARLAPGASLEQASTQLATVGQRADALRPEELRGLRTVAFPYTLELVGEVQRWILYGVEMLVSLLLVVIAINVATLVYARTVSRAGEIAVRTALGASRGRIVAQLFVEAFLLSSAAAVAGLFVARSVLERIELSVRSTSGEQVPFWWDFGLSPSALAYGFGLAVLAAVIVGVVPALGATGRRLRTRLQSVGSGASAPRLGRTWTALIVAQIAVAVAILPVALNAVAKWGNASRQVRSEFPIDEVLIAYPVLDRETENPGDEGSDEDAAYRTVVDEVVRRFEARSDVAGVAVMGTAPWDDPDLRFELDAPTAAPLATPMESASTGHRVGRSRVSPEYFEAFDMPVLAGRGMDARDTSPGAGAAVVNRTFVDLVMGGESPLGRRLRFPSSDPDASPDDAPWYTIVGVVPNLMPGGISNPEARAYLPLTEDATGQVSLAIRVRGGNVDGTTAELRRLAAEIDPLLRMEGLRSLEALFLGGREGVRLLILGIAVLSLATLLLAVAGLYALMSFTVVRRHREIGIRTTLGARPHHLLRSIMSRVAWQLGIGVVVGLGLAWGLNRLAGGEMLGDREPLILPAVALLMAAIGVLAAWGPVRRGLRVEPTEVLRAE